MGLFRAVCTTPKAGGIAPKARGLSSLKQVLSTHHQIEHLRGKTMKYASPFARQSNALKGSNGLNQAYGSRVSYMVLSAMGSGPQFRGLSRLHRLSKGRGVPTTLPNQSTDTGHGVNGAVWIVGIRGLRNSQRLDAFITT